MQKKPGKYFFIPEWLLQESGQTIHAYIFILNEIHINNGDFLTTKNEIATALDLTERQVRTILTKLSERGYAEIKPMANRKTSLSINFIGVLEDFEKEKVKTPPPRQQNSFDFKKALIDYGFKKEIVEDWLKVRKTKKATNTEIAFNSFIKEIESRSCDINEMLKTSVTNSWSGFKHIWVDNLKNATTNQQEPKIGRTSIETIKKNGEYNGQY